MRITITGAVCTALCAIVLVGCGTSSESPPRPPEPTPSTVEPRKTSPQPSGIPGLAKISPDQIDAAERAQAEEVASVTLTAWMDGQFQPLGDEFSEPMRTKLRPDAQERSATTLKGIFGEYRSIEFAEAWTLNEVTIYRFKGTFTKGQPEVRVNMDKQGKVGGFWCRYWADDVIPPAAAKARGGFSPIPVDQIDAAEKAQAEKVASKTFTAWRSGQFRPLSDEFSETVRSTLPPEAQKAGYAAMSARFGDYQTMEFVEALAAGDHRIYRFKGTFSKSNPEIRVTINDQSKVVGLVAGPRSSPL